MRNLYLFFLLIFGQIISAQSNLPVVWKTVDGIVDTGKLKRLPTHLRDNDELVLYRTEPDSIVIDQSQIEWVTYRGDTLLVRRQHNANSRLFRLLYQGEVRLYRVVMNWANRQYYLVRGGKWVAMLNLASSRAAYQILNRNCKELRPPTRLHNDYQAIALTRQINDCLNNRPHYALPTFDNHSRQIGMMYNSTGARRSNYDDRNTFRQDRGQPIFHPTFSLQFQYQLFKYVPKLKAQLGMNIFHRNERFNSSLRRFGNSPPVEEHWEFTTVDYYPGIIYYTGYRRAFQLSLGAGTSISMPLIARRTVVFTDGVGVAEFPIDQSIRNIIRPGFGYYFQGGVHLRLGRRLQLDALTKLERISSKWRHFDNLDLSPIVYSVLFPQREWLNANEIFRAQFRLLYAF